jgi:hypothetical protein
MNFDGLDDYIYTSFDGVSGNNPRTIEAWIKTSTTAVDPHYITDYGYFGTSSLDNGKRFTLLLNNTHRFRVEIRGWGINATTALNDGVWHHVAGTYDGTNVKLYVDGIEEASGIPPITVNTTFITDFLIGIRCDFIKPFEGDIDEVRFWDNARTLQEINLYKDFELCTIPANLVAYYQLNEGLADGTNTAITTITDGSGSSNNGILTGFSMTGTTSNFVTGAILSGATNFNQTLIECTGFSITVGPNTHYSTGVYIDTLTSLIDGCDSIVTTDLTITSIDNTTSVSGVTISANESGATYAWIDCDNGNAVIAGETSQDYTALSNGNYAVELSKNGCVDTSACVAITSVGILENNFGIDFKIYPNPNKGNFSVDLGETYNSILVTITDLNGKIIHSKEYSHTHLLNVKNDLPAGVYLVIIQSTKNKSTIRLVKE